eukprot:m.99205 g.99205  ORF g.99205 m.99205 type:complete len:137 (-) comp16766_c0_seq11:3961-4371(-)
MVPLTGVHCVGVVAATVGIAGLQLVITANGIRMPPPWLYLPIWVALPLALFMRCIALVLACIGVVWRPSLTPESVRGLCYSQWFTGARAVRELGYHPIVPPDEAHLHMHDGCARVTDGIVDKDTSAVRVELSCLCS